MSLPRHLDDEADCHSGVFVCAAESVHDVKLLAGKLVNSYLLNGFPGLLGGSVVVVLVLVRGPPDGVFGILVLNDELILGGTSGVDTGHNVHGAQLTDLSFFIALK